MKTKETAAIGCFVKTPGLSQIKSRLTESSSQEVSSEFYRLSIKVHRQLLLQCKAEGIAFAHWIVAEKNGFREWADLDCIYQGSGGLGKRLITTYNKLRSNSDKVIVIGSDTPQLSLQHIQKALFLLDKYEHVIGPSHDGGFYLFASRMASAPKTWEYVSYSTSETKRQFTDCLSGDVYALELMQDADYFSDLIKVRKELEMHQFLNCAQKELLSFLSQFETL